MPSWVVYNDFKANVFKKLIDCTSDVFKVALFTSSSIAISVGGVVTPATYPNFFADGHEVAGGGDYTTGGLVASAPTLTGGGAVSTITFNLANVSWPIAGAGFTCRAAVLYDDTSAGKLAVAYCILDPTPADVTAVAPSPLTINVGNIFGETGN